MTAMFIIALILLSLVTVLNLLWAADDESLGIAVSNLIAIGFAIVTISIALGKS